MGCSVYCRTCAVAPRDLADGMIDIFANTKIIALLSTVSEWQLDISQDDGLSQCICKRCEMALIEIDTFRMQALRAKEYLQTQIQALDSTTQLNGDGEAIRDNEIDLHTERNCGGVQMHNREALPRTLQSECEPKEICKNTISIFNANEKMSENEQSNNCETSFNAVIEETGELSFDSNIESSRPLEFQVILIEEEDESTLQWINEDDNAGEKRIQPFTSGTIDNKSLSVDTAEAQPNKDSANCTPCETIMRAKKQNQKRKTNYKIAPKKFSSLVENNSQTHSVHEDSIKEIVLHYDNITATSMDEQVQIDDIQTLLAINRESSTCSADDLQSVLMNQLTLQMINANVNILEEDVQIDDFENLLAAIDAPSSSTSIKNNKEKYCSRPFENGENVFKKSNGNLKGSHQTMPDKGDNSLTETGLYIDKLIVPTSNRPSNDKSNANIVIENQKLRMKDVRRSNKITSKSMRCRLCVCKVSDRPVFATKQILDEHVAAVHDDNERPYNCPQCTARYRTRSGCVAHINAIHLKKGDKCELCDKVVVGGAGQMRMHIERNHTHGNYTCEICQIELKNISLYNFKYHKRWHNEDKLWRCELCEKAFVTRTHLMEHKVTHTRQGKFLCTRCGKSTRSKWELRTHLYAIHGEGEAPLKCNYCDEKFTQHVQKRAHLERFHPAELAKHIVPCQKCDKHFSTETNLQRHIKQHHNGANTDMDLSAVGATTTPLYEGFMCAHCPRKYRSKYALIKHLRVHAVMADRPYSCSDCEMHFKHFSELDRHDLQHHATVRPYRCGKCSKAFATKTALKIHGQVHEVKGRNLRCPECNQRFKFEKSLNLHIISHKTMRHSCEICGKSYIRLTQLKTHKKRYHKTTNDSEEE